MARSSIASKPGKDSRMPRALNKGQIRSAVLKVSGAKLISALADETGVSRKTSAKLLESLSEIAYREVKKHGEVTIPGLGKLVKQQRKARSGRNPATGAEIKIPAKTVIKFRVAKAAKDSVLAGGRNSNK